MMQIVPKWKVSVTFKDRGVVFWVYDAHMANALRKIADLQFSENGLEQPEVISIKAEPPVTATTQSHLTTAP